MDQKKQKKIKINLGEEVAQGHYVNLPNLCSRKLSLWDSDRV